jgi:hypothetical protein
MVLKWNEMPRVPPAVDVVLHLHGYSGARQNMILTREKEPFSGLDFSDPDNPAAPGRRRPTLAILPRGNYFGGESASGYNFPELVKPGAAIVLIEYALEQFGMSVGAATKPSYDRIIATAHSGGGSALMEILRSLDPNELHVFDATYSDPASLIDWARTRVSRDIAALEDGSGRHVAQYMSTIGGALRVLYRAGSGTEAGAREVHRALLTAIPAPPRLGTYLGDWYRVEATTEAHGTIPRRYGWRLLANSSATLSQSAAR